MLCLCFKLCCNCLYWWLLVVTGGCSLLPLRGCGWNQPPTAVSVLMVTVETSSIIVRLGHYALASCINIKKIQINLLFKNFQIWYFYHIPTIKFLIPKMYLKCLQRPWTQFLFIRSHDRIILKNTANETSTILWGPFLAMSKFNTFPAPP